MDKNTRQIIKKGNQLMAESSICFCSIIRNGNSALIKNIKKLEVLRSKFKNSQVVVFENDSTDGTKDTLAKWSNEYENVLAICQNFKTNTIPSSEINGFNKYFSNQRISKMANYRNQYLKVLSDLKSHYDYIMIVDLDIEDFSIDGVAHSFGLAEHWDVITANGYSYSPSLKKRYHDTYALTEIGTENMIQTEEVISDNQQKWSFLNFGMPLIPVYSAYGGLAIYKGNVLKNKTYEALQNNDARVEVKCEHFSLHHQIQQENRKIFINPNMTVLYQKVSFTLMKKYLREKLNLF